MHNIFGSAKLRVLRECCVKKTTKRNSRRKLWCCHQCAAEHVCGWVFVASAFFSLPPDPACSHRRPSVLPHPSKKRKKDEKKGSERSAGIRSKSTASWRGEIHKAHPSFASPLLALPALRSDALPRGHGHETAQLGGASCLRESQQQLSARRVSECHEFD